MSTLEPIILERVRLAIRKIGEESKVNGNADVLKWWTLLSMDVIGELCFGESFHLLELGKVGNSALILVLSALLTSLYRRINMPQTSPMLGLSFHFEQHFPR